MPAWMSVEEESGTSRHLAHPHNGYYAGDFSQSRDANNAPVRRDGQPPSMQLLVLATGDRLMLW